MQGVAHISSPGTGLEDDGLAIHFANRFLRLYPGAMEQEDAVQEARLVVHRYRPRHDPARGEKSTFYGYWILHHLQIVSGVRRKRPGRPLELDAPVATEEGQVGRLDVTPGESVDPAGVADARRALERLQGRPRRLIEAELRGERDEAVAAQEGLSVASLRVQRSRAMSAWRELVGVSRDVPTSPTVILDRIVALLEKSPDGLKVREMTVTLRVRRAAMWEPLAEGQRTGRLHATGRTGSRRFFAAR